MLQSLAGNLSCVSDGAMKNDVCGLNMFSIAFFSKLERKFLNILTKLRK